jgi:membrane protein DedA with SNARE-associated domain
MTTHRCNSVIFIPPTLLVFGAGYAFTIALDSIWLGILASTMSCFMGSCLGAVIAFLRARYMMRDLVHLFSRR